MIKSINAVTSRLLVIRDILRFNNLKGSPSWMGHWSSLGGGKGVLFVLGVSIPGFHLSLGGINLPL